MNLADVYMDAVLHPDIYRKRQVFEQEGWHYELVAADEAGEGEAGSDSEGAGAGAAARPQLAYNGVVYNEMKGALSDASSVLYDQLQASLFPDTPYAFESGGTPEAIPTLTYEHYLEEHAAPLPPGQQLPDAVRQRGFEPHAGVFGRALSDAGGF